MNPLKQTARYVLSPILLLVAWEIASRSGLLDMRFFPPPSEIFYFLFTSAIDLNITHDIGVSLSRIAIGFFAGSVLGVAVGFAMGLNRVARDAIYPLVSLFYPLPKIAIFPLIMLIFGLGETSKILVIALGSFFLVTLNTLGGVEKIPRHFFDFAQVHRIPLFVRLRSLVLPAASPSIFTGLRLALGYSFVMMVAAEFSGANEGIGYWIWQSWETFSLKAMYGGIFVIAIIGWISTQALDWIERKTIPWAEAHRQP